MNSILKKIRENVNLRTIIISIIILGVGISLFWLSTIDYFNNHECRKAIVLNFGSTIIVMGGISLSWELFLKRAFLDEILAKTNISKEITSAGIIKVTDLFVDNSIEWKSYFSNNQKLDLFFAYGRTWRNIHNEELKKFAAKKSTQIRVVLPDPDDDLTIKELARRFKYDIEELKNLIKETETYFMKLGKETNNVSIWFLPATPTFSFYIFDNIAIFALYTHQQRRLSVPTFIVEKGGTLYNFISEEFEAMVCEKGLAKLVKN